jgi:molecular chaperone IbpA
MTRLDLPTIARGTVGFDRLFNEVDRMFANSVSTGFPPYNIVLVDDNKYEVTLAVAGFSMDDIEITQDGNVLRVEGTTPEAEDVTYLHKGIAARSFKREFALADHVRVESADLENGMLTIALVREVPEALQPKKIAITQRS